MSLTVETEVGASISTPVVRKVHTDTPSSDFGFLPIPKKLRYDPEKPSHFGLLLNVSFGFAGIFTMANLYYCQPLLSRLKYFEFSKSFDVSYDEVSVIPTLAQAGYAAGILLVTPLGDLVRRRQLILLLVFASTSLTVGLSITPNIHVFEALCFLIGVATVTPQILMPLAADLAPPERRASAMSVVFSGLVLGALVGRVLAGIIGDFSSWRIVYYMAIGVQCVVLLGTYLILPDYPPKNPDLTYFQILYTMAKYAVTEPLVVQTALIGIASCACFTSFWVTLTFLLGGSPYYYSALDIGLFGLLGMFGVIVVPLMGRLIDKVVPWYGSLGSTLALIVFQAVQTAAGGINVSAVIIACFGFDAARQAQLVALFSSVLSISAAARARLNAIFVLSLFVGQVMGTSVGAEVFVRYGWRASALLLLGLYGFQLGMLLLRGPHCPRKHWFGWAGGWEARRSVADARKEEDAFASTTPIDERQPGEKMRGELKEHVESV